MINEKRKTILQGNLKSILNFKGLTQDEFAKYVGCARTLISSICTGYTKMTNMQYLAFLYIFEKELGFSEREIEAFCTNKILIKKEVVKVLLEDKD